MDARQRVELGDGNYLSIAFYGFKPETIIGKTRQWL